MATRQRADPVGAKPASGGREEAWPRSGGGEEAPPARSGSEHAQPASGSGERPGKRTIDYVYERYSEVLEIRPVKLNEEV